MVAILWKEEYVPKQNTYRKAGPYTGIARLFDRGNVRLPSRAGIPLWAKAWTRLRKHERSRSLGSLVLMADGLAWVFLLLPSGWTLLHLGRFQRWRQCGLWSLLGLVVTAALVVRAGVVFDEEANPPNTDGS
jgi:hypothetical protein